MSKILRRPMFRGGSTNNEGIMSIPRQGYSQSDAGGVQSFNPASYYISNSSTNGGLFDNEEDNTDAVALSNNDSIDLNKLDNIANKTIQSKNITDERLKNLSTADVLMAEYLGNRPDPMGKFLIQFGLNYMSATPKKGKFGALTTAAESAKKPTEQLYSDIDTDRLLKLKLMTALGKSETPGAFEKKINFIWKSEQNKPEGLRTFKSKEEVVDWVRKEESTRKEQSAEVQINDEAKKIMDRNEAPNFKVAKNQAYFNLFGMDKLPKSETDLLANKYFLQANSLTKKPNSTEFALTDVKNVEGVIGKLKDGKVYVDPGKRQLFLFLGNNTFRPLSTF